MGSLSASYTPAPLRQGLFFVFEGIDGCGKSTQVTMLAEHLRQLGVSTIILAEPTQGTWGQKALQLVREGRKDTPLEEELRLFMQDRQENVQRNILPALRARQAIVQDRYYFSNAAYQGALGIAPSRILEMHAPFAPLPDAVFYLAVPVATALQRIAAGRARATSFEKQSYLDRVARNFDGFHLPYFHRLDATQPAQDVFLQVMRFVDPLLDQYRVSGDPDTAATT